MSKKTNKTKYLISLAMSKLILRGIPYETINVKELCNVANVSRMSFYRYYNKKEDVLLDYCDERFEEFYELFMLGKDPTPKEFVKNTFDFFEKNYRQLLILRKANQQDLLRRQFDHYSKYLVNNWKTIKESDNYSKVVPIFLSGGLFNVLMAWIDTEMKQDKEIMTDLVFRLFPHQSEELDIE